MNKYFKIIIYMLCSICCIIQITQISEIYFSYETTTDVKYEFEDPIQLPALTLCGPKKYFVNKVYYTKFNQTDHNNAHQLQGGQNMATLL